MCGPEIKRGKDASGEEGDKEEAEKEAEAAQFAAVLESLDGREGMSLQRICCRLCQQLSFSSRHCLANSTGVAHQQDKRRRKRGSEREEARSESKVRRQ